jgi:putative Mn2+ efflux pump MntP
MNPIEIFILSIGLSMDAFAVAIGIGLTMPQKNFSENFFLKNKNAIIVGFYFGFFQAVMPLVGYFAAVSFAEYVVGFGHWIGFGLLVFLGGKMIWSGFRGGENSGAESLSARKMIPLALATSVDAMAVGVSFALAQDKILSPVVVIGAVTFFVSAVGVRVGNVFGEKFKTKALFLGGIILILIGLRILLSGEGVFA